MCKNRIKDCDCTSKLKNMECETCYKPGVDFKCDLPKERDFNSELTEALGKYKGSKKIRIISELQLMMAKTDD